MSGPVPAPPGDRVSATREAKSTVEISPFIAWMSRHGHWILFALFASEVLFEGWAIQSAKRRDARLEAERAAPAVAEPVVRDPNAR